MKIYIIAGELSGDNIGQLVMKQLINQYEGKIDFRGVGGDKMISSGLTPLFSMRNISIMGYAEIIPKIWKIFKLIRKTKDDIINFKPDIVITIDSPGFNYRVAKLVKNKTNAKLVHIVAPSVWAYKPERAKKYAQIFDLLLALLPFEPKYFLKENLDCKFVGYFALEQDLCKDNKLFYKLHQIEEKQKIICVTPGSRESEVRNHLKVFVEAFKLANNKIDDLLLVIVAASPEMALIAKEILSSYEESKYIIILQNKFAAYKAAYCALAKSGTNVIEIAAHGVPVIVGYKTHPLTWFYVKNKLKIKFATLINIIANKEIIPEFIQNNFRADLVANKLIDYLNNPKEVAGQVKMSYEAMKEMGGFNVITPSEKAANHILDIYKKTKNELS